MTAGLDMAFVIVGSDVREGTSICFRLSNKPYGLTCVIDVRRDDSPYGLTYETILLAYRIVRQAHGTQWQQRISVVRHGLDDVRQSQRGEASARFVDRTPICLAYARKSETYTNSRLRYVKETEKDPKGDRHAGLNILRIELNRCAVARRVSPIA